MEVWRKQTTRWTLNGKKVPKGTAKAKKETILSKRFYGTLKDADGKRKQVPLCEDKEASQTLLRRLQTEAEKHRALGVPRHERERLNPLSPMLDDYEKHLTSKGNTAKHVGQTIRYIKTLLAETKTKTLDDLDAQRIANTLATWRTRKKKALSVRTTNYYARAIKGFSRWLWIERRTSDDPLLSLRLLNAKADRSRERRALSSEELQRLIRTTETTRKRLFGLTPKDREPCSTWSSLIRVLERQSWLDFTGAASSFTVGVVPPSVADGQSDEIPLIVLASGSLNIQHENEESAVNVVVAGAALSCRVQFVRGSGLWSEQTKNRPQKKTWRSRRMNRRPGPHDVAV